MDLQKAFETRDYLIGEIHRTREHSRVGHLDEFYIEDLEQDLIYTTSYILQVLGGVFLYPYGFAYETKLDIREGSSYARVLRIPRLVRLPRSWGFL